MELFDFTPAMADEWDAFVANHPLASYGHLSAQFALADATPGVRNVSMAVRDGRNLAAVLPLFVNDHHVLRRIPVRELTSGAFFPAGPLVAPKLQGKAEHTITELLLNGIRHRLDALHADRVLITHPNVVGGQPSITRFGYSPLLHQGFRPRHGVGLLLDLSQTPEQLAAGRRSGCRQSVNKAQASGAVVSVIANRAEWLACHDINVQTLGPLAYSERQMAAIWDHFIAAGHATAYGTYLDGVLAAVTVTVHFNRAAYYWIGLGRRPSPLTGAGHLSLWTAILAAREQGCAHFELGSLDFENPRNVGISQFKQSFGGVPSQIISAQLEARPVKAAAIALGEALIAALRERRHPRRPPEPATTSTVASHSEPSDKRTSSKSNEPAPQPAGAA
jgi:hypothetical protein